MSVLYGITVTDYVPLLLCKMVYSIIYALLMYSSISAVRHSRVPSLVLLVMFFLIILLFLLHAIRYNFVTW